MSTAVSTLRTALADARTNRASFLLQLTFMVVNDVTWVVFWGLFFHRVGTANGWTFDDVLIMFSLLTVIAGVGLGVFANCRRIGQLAADGALDEVLVLPLRPLGQLLTRRVEPTNLGDLVFGLLLFLIATHPTPERLLLFVLGVAAGSLVFVGFMVLLGALTMFVGGRGEQADIGFNALILLASYPLDFFGGPVKFMLFTIVPAAFLTGVPVSLFRHFDPLVALVLLAVGAAMALLAMTIFNLGLRRYTSGSLWRR